MNRPIFDENIKRVTPQLFGAMADGKTDDSPALEKAIAYASAHGFVLELPEGDYYCSEITTLRDVTVLSQNAKISFHGMHLCRPAIDMKDNVKIFGKLSVWIIDNQSAGPNHSGRCCMAFGVYETGEGAHHCYVEDVTFLGGGAFYVNGILITGDSCDITLGRVTVPQGQRIYRGVGIHWGNSQDHYNIGEWSIENGYGHRPNWKPIVHPHDIHVGTVECYGVEGSTMGHDQCGALTIAAGYDVEVDGKVIGQVTTGYNSISTGKSVCMALIDAEYGKLGTEVQVRIRKKVFPGVVTKKRFYEKNYKK